jgi:predicted RNase H-like nuclease (RuvC/YqgF family)
MIMAEEGHGGMSKAALLLHQKQAEDAEKMDKRMCEIEKKVDSLDNKVVALDNKIDNKFDELKKLIIENQRHNYFHKFSSNLADVITSKFFLYILVIATALLCGIPIAQLGLPLLQ